MRHEQIPFVRPHFFQSFVAVPGDRVDHRRRARCYFATAHESLDRGLLPSPQDDEVLLEFGLQLSFGQLACGVWFFLLEVIHAVGQTVQLLWRVLREYLGCLFVFLLCWDDL